MTHDADQHSPVPRRARLVGVALLAAGLTAGLTACGPSSPTPPGPGTPGPAASAPPGPTAPPDAAAALPDVPVRDAGLADVTVPEVVPPVSLAVPDLGIALPVDPVGVQPDGQMEIPPLAERAGWYRFGAAPGAAAGTAVVAAHVDSVASAGLGPFARLGDAETGDVVDVTLADGSTRRYAVTTVGRQDKAEIVWDDVFVRDGAHRLVLVTCGGVFQPDVGSYRDNVIVTAEPVGGP